MLGFYLFLCGMVAYVGIPHCVAILYNHYHNKRIDKEIDDKYTRLGMEEIERFLNPPPENDNNDDRLTIRIPNADDNDYDYRMRDIFMGRPK